MSHSYSFYKEDEINNFIYHLYFEPNTSRSRDPGVKFLKPDSSLWQEYGWAEDRSTKVYDSDEKDQGNLTDWFILQYHDSNKNFDVDGIRQLFIAYSQIRGKEKKIRLGSYKYFDSNYINGNKVSATTQGTFSLNADKIMLNIIKPMLKDWVYQNVKERNVLKVYNNFLVTPDNDKLILAEIEAIGKQLKYALEDKKSYKVIGWSDDTKTRSFNELTFWGDLVNKTNNLINVRYKTDAYVSSEVQFDLMTIMGVDEAFEDIYDDKQITADVLEDLYKDRPEIFKKILPKASNQEYKEPTKEDLINYRQCALVTELIHNPNGNFGNYWNSSKFNTSPLSGNTGQTNRIYPVTPSFPSMDLSNLINVSSKAKDSFKTYGEATEENKSSTLDKKFYWVFDKDDGSLGEKELRLNKSEKSYENNVKYSLYSNILMYKDFPKEAQIKKISKALGRSVDASGLSNVYQDIEARFEELKTSYTKDAYKTEEDAGYYYLESTEIKFDGTNPSTARKDVQVSIKLFLSSISVLQEEIAEVDISTKNQTNVESTNKVKIKLHDLITLPVTNRIAKGPMAWAKNQYNPEYSRLRLKVFSDQKTNSDLIIDLTTIDHQIQRDSVTGHTNLTINYRGFFETMMDMPFNDVLASDDVLQKRAEISSESMTTIRNSGCDSTVIANATKLEQEIYKANANQLTAGSMLSRLAKEQLIYYYSVSEETLLANSSNGTLDSFYNYVTDYGKTDTESVDNALTAITEIKKEDKNLPEKAKNKFFFLGDLMHIVSNCIYDDSSSELKMKDIVKSLNLRFLVGNIQVPNPKDPSQKNTINPLCIPIDLLFFVEWFNSTIVNKGISTYPIGVFIRDLIDRLVNNIIYDVCFSTMPPGESPPVVRTQYASDFRNPQKWFVKNEFGWFDPKNPFNDQSESDPLFFRDANVEIPEPNNYIILYQQFPAFSLTDVRNGSSNFMKDSRYVPTIFYGNKNKNYNFLSSVSFSKTNSQFLREARYFNSNYGNLSLLSNVYDLNFTFNRRMSNTYLYPGVILNFILLDWKFDGMTESPYDSIDHNNFENSFHKFNENNPHDKTALAHILGFGGYYIIKSVTYKLYQVNTDWEISVETKFLGTDANPPAHRDNEDIKQIEYNKNCEDAYSTLLEEARTLEVNTSSYDLSFAPEKIETPPEQTDATGSELKVEEQTNEEIERQKAKQLTNTKEKFGSYDFSLEKPDTPEGKTWKLQKKPSEEAKTLGDTFITNMSEMYSGTFYSAQKGKYYEITKDANNNVTYKYYKLQ